MSTRRRKWPTFRTSFSLCSFVVVGGRLRNVICFLPLCLSSLYRRRIPSGLLFVIHSINVCCLWDLLLLFFFCNFVSFSYVFNLVLCCDLCHAISTHTHTHTHCVVRVRVWSWLCSLVACSYTCFAIASKWWWVSLRPNMCLCEFAQTLAIVPRVMRWIGILVNVSFLSQNFLWKTSVVVTYYKISNKTPK